MLLFDMDGTLIDSNGVWKNVDREFLARRGIAYTHAYYEGVAIPSFPWPPSSPRSTAASRSPARRSLPSGWRWPGTPMPMSR